MCVMDKRERERNWKWLKRQLWCLNECNTFNQDWKQVLRESKWFGFGPTRWSGEGFGRSQRAEELWLCPRGAAVSVDTKQRGEMPRTGPLRFAGAWIHGSENVKRRPDRRPPRWSGRRWWGADLGRQESYQRRTHLRTTEDPKSAWLRAPPEVSAVRKQEKSEDGCAGVGSQGPAETRTWCPPGDGLLPLGSSWARKVLGSRACALFFPLLLGLLSLRDTSPRLLVPGLPQAVPDLGE